ncbi:MULTISPECIES: OmpA family protein [Gammaproteobacteria]|jgi:outer membrane protein OmpA-like peptidoglycan-associated protein|uniref:OmpA family protein n=1 Tax=Gammaproteobacteria TaxID=1236 RepID=UPI00110A4EA8|nr:MULTISPECIES: OmpA family protein [Gammaproteobacteria]MDA0146667.1 OmpA family protein [Vibrio sp. RW]MDC9502454.1 OmpA family protein [Pseudoalteromonas sp. Angola-18]MDC9510987.1 OmpA family protein [Pseudoalteromonas sp. Angola-4]MDC9525771.1 OmpA family protein [Pseudoalteromonas sp. Angola-30]MDC9529040.1 OmpA family protein [Pseudoalteromonas sp. Angola-7]
MKKIALLSAALLLTACATEPGPYEQKLQSNDLLDQDQDGVINERDKCADTPFKAVTDNDGCPLEENISTTRGVVINFEFDKHALTTDAKQKVAEFARSIENSPLLSVILIGDTSKKGSLEYNRKLALKRIETVKSALLALNVSEEQISQQTFIETKKIPTELQGRETRVIALVEGEQSSVMQMQFDVYNSTI